MHTRIPHVPSEPRPVRGLMRTLAGAAMLVAMLIPSLAHAATYDPLNIIAADTWRASSSLSTADIQAFLATQSGPLAALVTTDYVTPGGANGYGIPWTKGLPARSAAQIIHDAGAYWNVNPKMLLATLQKEQSLLTVSNSSNATRLRKAMGYGVYSGSPNTFPGFGNQVFNAARGYSQYETRWSWRAGLRLTIELQSDHDTTITIVPKTWCTYGLYKYTPYYPQKSFWTIYTRYFEDPLAPARLRPVYRFRNTGNGTYYYTASEAKRYTLIRTSAKKWSFSGVSFTADASATANTFPLFRLYNTLTHKYTYTAYASSRDRLLAVRPRQWKVDGTVAYVAHDSSGTAPVFRLENKTTHASIYTASASFKKSLTTGHAAKFTYKGVAFYLDSLETTSSPVAR